MSKPLVGLLQQHDAGVGQHRGGDVELLLGAAGQVADLAAGAVQRRVQRSLVDPAALGDGGLGGTASSRAERGEVVVGGEETVEALISAGIAEAAAHVVAPGSGDLSRTDLQEGLDLPQLFAPTTARERPAGTWTSTSSGRGAPPYSLGHELHPRRPRPRRGEGRRRCRQWARHGCRRRRQLCRDPQRRRREQRRAQWCIAQSAMQDDPARLLTRPAPLLDIALLTPPGGERVLSTHQLSRGPRLTETCLRRRP